MLFFRALIKPKHLFRVSTIPEKNNLCFPMHGFKLAPFRIKQMLETYPMLNQHTEKMCTIVWDRECDIKRNAREWDGCIVENIKPHILSDLCIIPNDKSLPTVRECHHSDENKR